jgi:hypothetical protein
MAANLRILDGNPVWASASIVPSKDTVVSPNSAPSVAAVLVASKDVYVYVKVENTGTVDLGQCQCTVPVPASWPTTTPFTGFLANAGASTQQTQAGVTFMASPNGDSLSGGVDLFFGVVASGRRAWGWSPDNRFFAYAAAPSGPDWFLTIVALQNITRPNGTVINKGQVAANANGLFAGPPFWTNANFGWAGARAVIASGTAAGGGQIARSVVCPEAPGNSAWGETIPEFPGELDWTNLFSPCGSIVAFVPKILKPSFGSRDIVAISTATAQPVQLRQNNVPTSVTIAGPNPSIVTKQHAAKGVHVTTGVGPGVDIDDPDCGVVSGGGVVAWVDRVKASTLPSANLGVVQVGSGVVSLIKAGQSYWVQVPPPPGWANQGEPHWCLLAQAYTTIPKPWNGQAPSPPQFPVGLIECAQRNISIN